MAWSFGDSFDLYAAVADAVNGYWDSSAGPFTSLSLNIGRFSGSQSLRGAGGTGSLIKTSGVNDSVHHFVVSFLQTAAVTGTNLGFYLQLFDGATAQCSVVFRSDGAILLASGGPAGTVLATYTGAFPVTATWYAFEIEVVINNTTGSFSVRKNGNLVNDFTLGSLNTRGGTANNYANKLQIGQSANVAQGLDDLFWRSDASSVAWLGDIRCYARMPASDASVTFSRSPSSPLSLAPFPASSNTGSLSGGSARYVGFISQGGNLTNVAVTFVVGYTGNLKCALFGCTSGALGTGVGVILGTATASIANPVTGVNTFTFSPAIAIPVGTLFYVGVCSDTGSGAGSIAAANSAPSNTYGAASTTAYASFPVASPVLSTTNSGNYNIAPAFSSVPNCSAVMEPQQDALTSYVYDSTPGDADFYGVASIASTPATVIATTVRAYAQKSDAGTRTMAVQLKSGSALAFSTTWSLSDIASITLTGGNLTATSTATSAGARSSVSVSSGKQYWEITTGATFTGANASIGIALAGGLLSTMASVPLNACLCYKSNGAIWFNNANTGSALGVIGVSTVVGIALDMTALLIWFRLGAAGNWNGSGTANPATGVGGISLSGVFSGAAPAFATVAYGGSIGDSVTANFGGSAFTGAVPSGFAAGFGGTSGTVVASPTLVLTTSGFAWAWRTDTIDPATGAAWTPAAVNNCQIGPKTVA